nr:hypothetical protein CFP56_78032 [Quercus suber]
MCGFRLCWLGSVPTEVGGFEWARLWVLMDGSVVGMGPRSWSLKLLWLGVMSMSMMTMTKSEPKSNSLRRLELPVVLRPRN